MKRVLPFLMTLLVLMTLWQGAIAVFNIPAFVLPGMDAIVSQALHEFKPLSVALGATMFEALSGYMLGAVAGLTLAVAMLLVRPLLETNRQRTYVSHTVVFFIFVVCNCGGCLRIGDSPLPPRRKRRGQGPGKQVLRMMEELKPRSCSIV